MTEAEELKFFIEKGNIAAREACQLLLSAKSFLTDANLFYQSVDLGSAASDIARASVILQEEVVTRINSAVFTGDDLIGKI